MRPNNRHLEYERKNKGRPGSRTSPTSRPAAVSSRISRRQEDWPKRRWIVAKVVHALCQTKHQPTQHPVRMRRTTRMLRRPTSTTAMSLSTTNQRNLCWQRWSKRPASEYPKMPFFKFNQINSPNTNFIEPFLSIYFYLFPSVSFETMKFHLLFGHGMAFFSFPLLSSSSSASYFAFQCFYAFLGLLASILD